MDSTNLGVVDMMSEKISSGFYHGWKKFKTSANAKPSDFITRRESLEVEINGGVLNQGKTFMRSFIAITTAVLFMFNLAYLGNDETITSYLIAETMMLPLIYFVVMKLFYFLYTSIKQQLYKQSVQSFYDVVGLLDEVFGVNQVVAPAAQVVESVETAETDESAELETSENEEELAEAEPEEQEEDNTLDRYDVFKKKNIDVDKIINEVPHNSGTSLPYINVDSDYVIKDDDSPAASIGKIVTDQDDASSILGGMMQDRAGLKKNNSNFLDVEKDIASIDEEKLEEAKAESEKAEETAVEEEKPAEEEANPFGNLEQFAVVENAEAEKTEETPAVEETPAEEKKEEPVEAVAPAVEETPVEEPAPVVEEAPVEEPVVDEAAVEEMQKEAIASVVSGFKTNRSKLASGGVIIERNEPIAKRERPVVIEEPVAPAHSVIDDFNDMSTTQSYYQAPQPQRDVVQQLSADNNADDILNSIKTSAGGYEYGYQQPSYNNQGFGAQPNYGYGAGYGVQQNVPNYGAGYGVQPNYGYGAGGYVQQQTPAYDQMNQQVAYDQEYEDYEDVEEFEDEDVEEVATKPAKKVRTKENEPRPRNLKKKAASMEENVAPAKTRGRPKKQEVSDSMVIKNDKEFNEVLSRAEKLMRKSDEGLSASQSKRIEKELKMLMDAMSRYKESK